MNAVGAERGRLIVLEGIEGAGKTTQMHAVVDWLRARGYDVVATREPGGTPMGERIRDLLLAVSDGVTPTQPGPTNVGPTAGRFVSDKLMPEADSGREAGLAMSPETELLLMFAARAEHWQRIIAPALAAGRIVVSDRFVDASYAYQGGGRGLGVERVRVLDDWLLGGARADLVLWFDVAPAVGLSRARSREVELGGQRDRFEREAVAFFERARAVYAERAAASPERYRRIDAERPPAEVRAQVEAALERAVAAWSETARGALGRETR